MSRIGKLPITIPAGVTVTLNNDVVTVKGPKGEMSQYVNPAINVAIEDGHVVMSENENALRLYHMAERKLKPYFKGGKLPVTAWRREHDRLEQEYKAGQAELSPIYAEVKKLWQIKYKVEQVVRAQENPEQSRKKQHQIDR